MVSSGTDLGEKGGSKKFKETMKALKVSTESETKRSFQIVMAAGLG